MNRNTARIVAQLGRSTAKINARNRSLAISQEERSRLCRSAVTLNGEPARIYTDAEGFAYVSQHRTGLGAQWAWSTAKRIIEERGGRFTA